MHYYQRSNLASLIEAKDFRAWIYYNLLPQLEVKETGPIIQRDISMALMEKGGALFSY